VLNGYRIEKPLSSGGFSIVYLARDEKDTPFAIKEYLPNALPLRKEGTEVVVDEANQALFRHGLKCFFEEGRALAMINHPNVVRVENFFRANETCYMVMQYVRGRTLQFHIQRHRHEFNENFIRRLFAHLMNGLREVHTRKLSEESMKLKTMYTAGFAAPEQYHSGHSELGPWSDIYSVGATMYTCIAGTPPQAGDAREEKDRIIPLKTLARGDYSQSLYDIVDSCLSIDHLKRPQTAFELQKLLMEEVPPEDKEKVKKSIFDTINQPLSKLFQR
jgi:serine/threonine protein kinase